MSEFLSQLTCRNANARPTPKTHDLTPLAKGAPSRRRPLHTAMNTRAPQERVHHREAGPLGAKRAHVRRALSRAVAGEPRPRRRAGACSSVPVRRTYARVVGGRTTCLRRQDTVCVEHSTTNGAEARQGERARTCGCIVGAVKGQHVSGID